MRSVLKVLGILAAALVVALVVAAIVLYAASGRRLNRTYAIEPEAVPIPAATDAEAIARGKYLVEAIAKCDECHGGEGLGGAIFADDPLLGRLSADNLTAGEGGVGANYEDADWVRAIRHGVGPKGKPLIFMPAQEFYHFSDADLGALIAYLKARPPVDNAELPPNRAGPLGRLLFLSGQLALVPAELIDHERRPEVPAQAATADYGAYLANTGGCHGCHGPGLSGGPIPGAPPEFPPARNLTPDVATGIGSWTIADFELALRRGLRPDGSALADEMPWRATAKMSDTDLEALWRYLRSVPPKTSGGR